ncbi:hypothetical protein LZP81_30905 [Streptomyces parvulus]|uniref:hypothetical protein n=1 Tax=Streptomyces parvulus TaxID=146923 RepID=UPI001E5A5A79|nr:hypothetical protein [Streptomyces parvulus]MCC9154885.1 hypothetical protein [Streptomyces parvulus]MCE7691270.1 hypothetical protein [Streptomyces parvulus]
MPEPTRIWPDSGDGWQELPGVVSVDLGYKPDDPVIAGYGAGEMRGLLEYATRVPTPVERALSILRPHLARCPLYRGV